MQEYSDMILEYVGHKLLESGWCITILYMLELLNIKFSSERQRVFVTNFQNF
jgi:hypothetical protein